MAGESRARSEQVAQRVGAGCVSVFVVLMTVYAIILVVLLVTGHRISGWNWLTIATVVAVLPIWIRVIRRQWTGRRVEPPSGQGT